MRQQDSLHCQTIFLNKSSLVNNVTVGEKLGKSDHNVIKFNLNVKSDSQLIENVKVFDFKNADFDKF